MKAEELRALLRQRIRVEGLDVVDAIDLKNGQTLGVVLVGKPIAGTGVKLIIEEREHGKSPKEEGAEEGREEASQEGDEAHAQESAEEDQQEASETDTAASRQGSPS
jgi:hypothetical protein